MLVDVEHAVITEGFDEFRNYAVLVSALIVIRVGAWFYGVE